MSWFIAVNNKINAMKQYCIDQSNAVCAAGDIANSVAAYTSQFNALSAAITTYIAANKANREQQIKDLITFDFIYTQTQNVNYSPTINKPTAPFPVGHTDYWDLFKMSGQADVILSFVDSYFFEGCILSSSGTTPRLQSMITTISGSEVIDSAARSNLILFLQEPSLSNTLIFLTELITVTGTFRSKTESGEIIYETKHAKEIINDFTLDVYIPTYI